MTSEQCPERALAKAKTTWTFIARFYHAAGNTTLDWIDYGNTVGSKKKKSAQKNQLSSEFLVEKVLPQYFGFSPYRV